MRILKAEPQVVQKLKDAGLLEDVESWLRAQSLYTQQETRKDTLKEVGEWLRQPCTHNSGIRRLCATCVLVLVSSLERGEMPD